VRRLVLASLLGLLACGSPAPSAATVEIRPSDGGLQEQLAARHAEAGRRGLSPFVQVYADWCGPCRALRSAVDDPRMQEAYKGTYVVRVELDAWKEPLRALVGSDGPGVPVFYAIEADGRLGRSVSGRAWGEDTVENFAPVLAAFFQGREVRDGVEGAAPAEPAGGSAGGPTQP
jgi:thiol-disulfide isomerase/thioredoxin